MALELYSHNQKAYAAAAAMLEEKGKAAVIHPTGTGKSFVAFQLIADCPDAKFLWLSPSEYIFRTQQENLRRIAPALSLENVRFYTYAKLMQLTQKELAELADSAAYIILDEFHRCGAACWGAGVARLLALCPKARLLGLSATNIRYLDNQRDMADELFDGNIASQMTLGEAVVRGILPCPHYISVVYHYGEELERYQKRIDAMKSGVRDASQQYLNALRRALDRADGMDRMFQKYLPDSHGKYIVFCTGIDHIQEMALQAREWLAEVDTNPHFYTVFSADPETSKAFAAFKADESAHLKLLFCVDMLNEGIHVQDIAGVILFRPTVSPIVYKQQIGRALTSGGKRVPVIFDCVCNAEGLCSIDGLRQEMTAAVERLYANGKAAEIVTERFTVTEQVQDCRLLFEQLESSLSSGWQQYFLAASLYTAEHGHLEVPRRYRTPSGLNLGRWLLLQAEIRNGRQAGVLTEQQIAQLDSIGMVWGNKNDVRWEQKFRAAERYYQEHGNLEVPRGYKTEDGTALGQWLIVQRSQRNDPQKQHLLTEERIRRLDSIGMVWDTDHARWDACYTAAVQYCAENGNLLVPREYITPAGIRLGQWIANLRAGYRKGGTPYLTAERIAALEALGMVWDNQNDVKWAAGYNAACDYFRQNGNLEVPSSYVTSDGLKLGRWIRRQRLAYNAAPNSPNRGLLTPERCRLLERIGMKWNLKKDWEYIYGLAESYLQETGAATIPTTYKTEDGICLGVWLRRQRLLAGVETAAKAELSGYKPLSHRQIEMVRRLGSL